MIANYHTHTARCHHAKGTEIEYVENAVERGLQILGFSDHTPQYFPGDYYSTMRMFPEELSGYCDTVRDLQKQFAGQLDIHLGVEAEYYPLTWGELVPRLRDAGVEYMILGQHWLGNEFDAPYAGKPTEDPAHLIAYCDQVIEAMETGKFTYFAHPDLVRFSGDRKLWQAQMRRICKASRDTTTPLEINFLGIRADRHYPYRPFWELVAEEGCDVILGIDAHSPGAVNAQEGSEPKALALVEEYGLRLLETLPLRKL